MVYYIKGNIFESPAEALVNTVNLVGVMGKGIALQFKNFFPNNFKAYKEACKNKEIAIGKLFITHDSSLMGMKTIINFPTKTDWRKPSEYEYIDKGLDNLIHIVKEYNIKSIAIPPLGCGNGGLEWAKVKEMMVAKLSKLEVDVYIFEPQDVRAEPKKNERVKLTEARALLLYILFDLVRQGEFVSEFSSEKVCYFLQRFGAKDIFKLQFFSHYYGPYSGKVKYVLYYLNGSYIQGYSDMNKNPFEILSLIPDSYEDIRSFVEGNGRLKEIAHKTMKFLEGYYSDFCLELLSSVDFILNTRGSGFSSDEIYEQLKKWSSRKAKMFSDKKYIEIARNHIITYCYE